MSSALSPQSSSINLDEPRYDQSTYWGRAKHFFVVTNPFNLLASPTELNKAQQIVNSYKEKKVVPPGLTVDELWRYKYLYDSAHHPETGERQFLLGRMSAQVPSNMVITGIMMTFYKTTRQVVFWQWFNQSFNAVVNYNNRSGSNPIPKEQLALSYAFATSGALVTALSLNNLAKYLPPIIGRFVPFCAVAAANCINIPMMRSKELTEGIQVYDEKGTLIGHSKIAAKKAITEVTVSRIGMAAPGMILPPFLMDRLEKKNVLKRYPWISAPLQIALCGFFLVFTTPLCCALFPQKRCIPIDQLEPEIRETAAASSSTLAFFNKGL